MSNRKNPQTSIDAWRQVHPDMLSDHHQKILDALSKGATSAEQLASRSGLSHHQVNRRISELKRKQLIYNTKLRISTSTGRTAFVWALAKPGEPQEKKTESLLPGKSVSDYSKELTKGFTQQSLF